MISSKLIVCASHVVRDADDETLSVIKILEGIKASGFPVLIQLFAGLVVWSAIRNMMGRFIRD